MMLARAVLGITGVVFAAIGIGFLWVPVAWARWVEILLPTPVARIDLRATYGGFDLAFGIFLLLCARRTAWIEPGLWACALALVGFAGGRIAGMAVERAAPAQMLLLLVVEVTLAALSLYALRRTR